jgi:hypothetical protein
VSARRAGAAAATCYTKSDDAAAAAARRAAFVTISVSATSSHRRSGWLARGCRAAGTAFSIGRPSDPEACAVDRSTAGDEDRARWRTSRATYTGGYHAGAGDDQLRWARHRAQGCGEADTGARIHSSQLLVAPEAVRVRKHCRVATAAVATSHRCRRARSNVPTRHQRECVGDRWSCGSGDSIVR